MYERLTDQAREVIQRANQEAQRSNHEYVGTEHILLGLISHARGVAFEVLRNLGVDLRRVRQEVERIILPGPNEVSGRLPQTPRAKMVLQYAIEESRLLGQHSVGTEHLLLGLLREKDGVAAQVLMNLGLRLDDVRDEVESLLGLGSVDRRQLVETAEGKEVAAEGGAVACDEYDLYLPLRYNDGSAIEPEKLDRVKKRLAERFGGLTFFPQRNEGTWKIGNVTFREEIVILRVLAQADARDFFARLKEELKADLRQEEVLIVTRRVRLL